MEKQQEQCSLHKNMSIEDFEGSYYLREELIEFCRENGLSTYGGKLEISDRIAHYLKTGERKAPKMTTRKKKQEERILHEDSIIEENFVCSQCHRSFFKEKIGPSFSFNVIFQNWLKEHAGATYQDAIEAYGDIMEEKKKGTKTIDRQFEYNTYIRDFFQDNVGRSLKEAIICWKYKKQVKGNHRYEKADLQVLKENAKD